MDNIIVISVILIIIFILINYNDKNIKEHYDDRYTNSTLEKCAKFCKTTSQCTSFGYDKESKTCYPSKSPISDKPENSIHVDSYSPTNVICNKFKPITQPEKAPGFAERRENSLFICSEREGLQPQQYFHNNDKLTKIDEGQNLDFITDVDQYKVKSYRWPRSKYDNDQLDLLLDVRKKQLTDNNLPSLEDIGKTVPINKDQIEEEIDSEEIKIKTEDISKMIKTRFEDAVVQTLNLPTQKEFEKIPDPEPTINKNDKYKLYKIYKERNKGEYLKGYKCVKDINLNNCLKYCNNNKECDGVEWNPKFYNYENVCCPYKNIGELVQRKDKHKHGKFYLKDYKNNTDRSKTYMFHN